uniref:Uncharacterized protein MANES_06G086000 n=1 Tax=Rhizophora mucronata TaxID=61149 RepID=A0A2P2JLD2_RHIMU
MTWIYTYICTKRRHVVVFITHRLAAAASRWQMETDERSSSSSSPSCSSYSPLPPSITRLWRPSAQRNLRNQWSNLNSCRKKWASSSFSARSHANSLVNAYLSQKYMPSMELGVLSDMPDIRKKACLKLFKQQESHRSKLLSSYREMVCMLSILAYGFEV